MVGLLGEFRQHWVEHRAEKLTGRLRALEWKRYSWKLRSSRSLGSSGDPYTRRIDRVKAALVGVGRPAVPALLALLANKKVKRTEACDLAVEEIMLSIGPRCVPAVIEYMLQRPSYVPDCVLRLLETTRKPPVPRSDLVNALYVVGVVRPDGPDALQHLAVEARSNTVRHATRRALEKVKRFRR